MLTEGVWAEVQVGKEHLRLFSENNAQGTQASVYNVNTKSWIAPSEEVEDIEEGKERTSEHARAYLKACGRFRTAAVGVEDIPLTVARQETRYPNSFRHSGLKNLPKTGTRRPPFSRTNLHEMRQARHLNSSVPCFLP